MGDYNEFNKLRIHCHDNAFYNFASAWIFEKRASKLRKRLMGLTFLGIVVPITIGSVVVSFGIKFPFFNVLITVGSILLIIQLICSILSLVAKWDDEFAYSSESVSSDYSLFKRFKELGDNPPQDISEFKIKVELLSLENKIRTDSDYKHNISEKEKRIGHRAALRQFQKECIACKKIPTSMKSSDCDICGNF